MYPSVISVTPQDNCELLIEFDNGESGMLDMKPYLDFGIFQKLKDIDAFQKVRVAFDSIEWDNGADLDPEFVYENCQKVVHTLNTRL